MSSLMAKLRAARTAFALLVLGACLQACGPGVGGSGTGQGVDAFGATAASLCGSDIAAALACPAGASSPPPGSGVSAGTGTVFFVDNVDTRRVVVTVHGNSIELNAPCARISFRGEWGLLAGQAARFYGLNGEGAHAQPAQVRASLSSGGVQLTVLDANGDVLLGPVLVTLQASAPTPGGC